MTPRILIGWAMTALLTAGAWAGVVEVKEPSVCYSCHDDVQSLSAKKFRHTAFTAGKCSACHDPHASRHAGLLNDDLARLCLSCHGKITSEIAQVSVHPPVMNGDCLACHDPHASDVRNQLKQKTPALCEGCHQNVAGWLNRAYVHQPAAQGNCQACHAAHGSDQDRLLSRAIPGLCFGCHKPNPALTAAHQGFDIDQADCTTCHDPHGSSLASLLMPNQHAPFKAGRCNSCHAPAKGGRMTLTGDVKATCGKCHQGVLKQASATYHHNLAAPRSCLNCHNAHASSAPWLLAAEQKDLCLRCHFKGDAYKGKKETYLTHDGMDCSQCHTPHGSDNSTYLVSTGIELCTGCHADAHKGSHPVGEGVIDPRTKTQMTCLSCHKLHGAAFKPYLPLDPSHELCLQCHRK
jgi:predicted CXXCH cytochrome family protein